MSDAPTSRPGEISSFPKLNIRYRTDPSMVAALLPLSILSPCLVGLADRLWAASGRLFGSSISAARMGCLGATSSERDGL